MNSSLLTVKTGGDTNYDFEATFTRRELHYSGKSEFEVT